MRFSSSTCLTIVLVCCVSGNPIDNSTDNGYEAWSKLEISPLAFQHMDYNYRQIDIYAHAKNGEYKDISRKKYYFIPLCELNPASAISKWNEITRQFEVTFQVNMWDQKVKQAVTQFLQTYEPGLTTHQIQVLPIDKVAIRCQECQGFTVFETPHRHASLPHKVDFKFACETRERCDEIASRMKNHPEDFSGLNLVFALQNQRSGTKRISVSSNVAFNGELYTKLRNEFPNKDSVYLTSDDAKKLVAQSVQEVQAEYVSDSDIFDKNFTEQVQSYIEKLLVAGRNDTGKFRDENWASVFWDQDIARPDVLVKQLNEIYTDVDEKAKNFLEQVYNETTKAENIDKLRNNLEKERSDSSDSSSGSSTKKKLQVGVSVGGGGAGFQAKVGVNYGEESAADKSASSKSSSDLKDRSDAEREREERSENSVLKALKSDDATQFLTRTKNLVSWNGTKFVPKPMSLTRVNTGSQASSTRLSSQQISLKYYSAALTTVLSIPEKEPPKERVVIYQEITEMKKNLGHVNEMHKSLTETDQLLWNTLDKKRSTVYQEIDKLNKGVNKLNEVEKASWKKDQQWQSAVDLTRANITGQMAKIIQTAVGEKAAIASILTPFLRNFSTLMRFIRNPVVKQKNDPDEEKEAPNYFRDLKSSIRSFFGCRLIPTSPSHPHQSFYYVCEKGLHWNTADQYCAAHGMRLAKVNDEDSYKQLSAFLTSYSQEKGWTYPSFWLGGTDSGKEGSWYWVADGQPMTLNKWKPNQPSNYRNSNNEPEDCLLISKTPHDSFVFDDFLCRTDLFFICELA